MPSVRLLSYRDAPAGFHPLDINTETGIRRFYQWDDEADEVRIVSVQDVDAVLDANAAQRYDARGRLHKADGAIGVRFASVPSVLANRWRFHDDGSLLDPDDADAALVRKLNSAEFAKCRVAEFQL